MSEGKSRQVVPGLILIVVGIVFLLGNFGALNLDWEVLWTWIIIVMGVIFWLGFIFDRSKDGLIMPGTILLTIGIVFNISTRYEWAGMEYLWPFFILAPAFGFYAMYLFGKRDRGILVPAVILTIVGAIFLMGSVPVLKPIWPLLLFGIAVLIITKPGTDKEKQDREG